MGDDGSAEAWAAFYADEYGGGLGEAAFASALPAALRHVGWLCGGRGPSAGAEEEAWKRAVCVAAEAFAEWGEGPSGGFRRDGGRPDDRGGVQGAGRDGPVLLRRAV